MAVAAYTLNAGSVAAERFGDELVIIQFDSGKYYSLGGMAVQVWDLLQAPVSVEGAAAALSAAAGVTAPPADAIARDVSDLLATFAGEGLVVPAEAAGEAPALAAFIYEAARIETYSDLADLVAIDPVHDVDAMMGWPRTTTA